MSDTNDETEATMAFKFRPYQPSHSQPYYVQSPSPLSYTQDLLADRHSDVQYSPAQNTIVPVEPSRFSLSMLSRYSSSRGSTNSEKPSTIFKTSRRSSAAVADVDDDEYENEELDFEVDRRIIRIRDILVKNDDEFHYDDQRRKHDRGCFRYFMIGRESSSAWICLQIGLRLVVSLSFALLVFYLATKPPRPVISIQMNGVREFQLGEGVDRTGIPTKILTCNSSIHLLIDNQSKVFGLSIHPPLVEMYFARLLLAVSREPNEMYADTYQASLFKLSIGTRQKPMYGAGRSMQDMLESGKGLPLMFKMTFRSNFHILGSLINPEYHHRAQCLVFLTSHYKMKHHTQIYNSTCTVKS